MSRKGMRPQYSLEAVRAAASGQWAMIVPAIAGIASDALGTKEGPCPKCGGKTRFRAFADFAEKGGVFCNQCHNQQNGDGFATIMWLCGVDFRESIERVAKYLHIEPDAKVKQPDDGLDWQPWSSDLVRFYLAAKPPITERALLLAGAKLARHKGATCIVLPVIDPRKPSAPVNYVLQNAMGTPLMVFDRKSKETLPVNKKCLTKGAGLVGVGIDKIISGDCVRVWKVEGITDMLALVSAMSDEQLVTDVVVTNAFGASEKPGWMADLLSRFEVCVLHDLDRPGDAGAVAWAGHVAQARPEGAVVVRLPGEVQESHGQDLRDWLGQGNTFTALLPLAEAGDRVIAKRNEVGDAVADEATSLAMEREICRAIQIEVLGELANGAIRLFSTYHRKTVEIGDIGRLKYERLIQIGGEPVRKRVHKGLDDVPGSFRFDIVRDAIAAIAGYRRIDEHSIVGQGVWLGRDLDDQQTGSIVLVNAADAARYNGDRVLRRVVAPRVDGLLLEFSSKRPWYDFDLLAANLTSLKESPALGIGAMDECRSILSGWRFKNGIIDVRLMTGCILASFVQTIWKWRPQVSVSGESSSGKSFLFYLLGGHDDQREPGIFLNLAFKTSKSTEAGIRQSVQSSAQVVMCDEFEASKERTKVLELIRTGGSGSRKAVGTSGQKAQSAGLQHICWVSAIETGLTSQADDNRFIRFELLRPEEGQGGKLKMPAADVRWNLGHRLLATAIHYAMPALALADQLRETQIEGVDHRAVENYAVVAAMLFLASGETDIRGAAVTCRALAISSDAKDRVETTHDQLFGTILGYLVNTGPATGMVSVGDILDKWELYQNNFQRLATLGIRVTENRQLFVATGGLAQYVLRGTVWEHANVAALLKRLPGAKSTTQRINSKPTRGVAFDHECWATVSGVPDDGQGDGQQTTFDVV